MDTFLALCLWIPFIIINIMIIRTDIREKKIPNKYLIILLMLLPPYYILGGHFWWIENISFFSLATQCIITFLLSFFLFHIWSWWAGDAKYLLVLSLFIPHIWIIAFVWNLWGILLCYLLLYFLYFWIQKIIHIWELKEICIWIYTDTKARGYEKFGNTHLIVGVLYSVIIFLSFFLLFRLLRIYVIQDFIIPNIWIFNIPEKTYMLISFGVCVIGVLLLWKYIRIWISYIHQKIYNSFQSILLSISIICILALLIVWEYMYQPYNFFSNAYTVFTLYLSIFIGIKILWYMQEIAFGEKHTDMTAISDIEAGMVINRKLLPLTPDKQYSINKKLNKEDIILLKEYWVEKVQIYRFFPLAPYLFLSFCLTYAFWDIIIHTISLIVKIYIFNITTF